MNFNGKRILVTGGASGIGEACARLFAECGGAVIIADKRLASAQVVAKHVGGMALCMDVADEQDVTRAAHQIEAEGPLDVLVNCAGILQRTLPPADLSMKEWDLVIRVDLRGTYLCCAAFGTRMATHGRGAIVNVASVAGMRSGPLHGYGPAKAGVIHMTECLAAEWGPRGLRVNAVSPGFTHTPALQRAIDTKTLDPQRMVANSAIGRLVQPAEIAAAVAFLSSDMASGITGINLPVDLGYLVATSWSSYGGLREATNARTPQKVVPA